MPPIANHERRTFTPRAHLLTMMILCWLFGLVLMPAHAQENLLRNPGFERSEGTDLFYGRPDFNIARGWGGWYTQTPKIYDWMNIEPIAYLNDFAVNGSSQEIQRGGGTFTAAVYQQVDGIAEGTTLRATAQVYLDNSPQSGAQVRIGIGYNTGNNPNGDIVWSGWSRSYTAWQDLSVERTVAAGSVTVFIYATQNAPNGATGANGIFIDNASLVAIGTGEVTDTGQTGADGQPVVVRPAPTTQPFAPFVQAGGIVNDQGQLIHIVQSGDTLAAIAVAYGVPASQIRALNGLEGGFLSIGQTLIIREAEPTAVPPTSTPRPTTARATSTPRPAVQVVIPTSADTSTAEEVVTEEAVEEVVTEEPTPEPTAIPVTPTEAPPAPVASSASDGNPTDGGTAVCVLLYEDVDQNRLQLADEAPLAGGSITLQNADGVETGRHETDGESESFCFENLSAGTYTARATAPEGYGLTTAASLTLNVQAGVRLNVSFGAAQGVQVAAVPTLDPASLSEEVEEGIQDAPEAGGNNISALLGVIVLGAAGVVLVGGATLAMLVRRR